MSFVRIKKVVQPSNPSSSRPKPSSAPVVTSVGSLVRLPKSSSLPVESTTTPGTRPWINGQVLTSTGVPQLDAVLGGGLSLGTLAVIVPDVLTSYAQSLPRALIAEGRKHGHTLVAVLAKPEAACQAFIDTALPTGRVVQSSARSNTSVDNEPASPNPAPAADAPEALTTGSMAAALRGEGVQEGSRLRVAWRYDAYSRALDAGGNLSAAGSLPAAPEEPDSLPHGSSSAAVAISAVPDVRGSPDAVADDFAAILAGASPSAAAAASADPLAEHLDALLARLWAALAAHGAIANPTLAAAAAQTQAGPPARVVIDCLDPLHWPASPAPLPALATFLHGVRAMARASRALVYVVSPPPTRCPPALLALLHRQADTCLAVQSFHDTLTPSAAASAYGDYDGLLTLHTLPRLHALKPAFPLPDTPHFLFRARSRGLELHKLALPPEVSRTPTGPAAALPGGAFDALATEVDTGAEGSGLSQPRASAAPAPVAAADGCCGGSCKGGAGKPSSEAAADVDVDADADVVPRVGRRTARARARRPVAVSAIAEGDEEEEDAETPASSVAPAPSVFDLADEDVVKLLAPRSGAAPEGRGALGYVDDEEGGGYGAQPDDDAEAEAEAEASRSAGGASTGCGSSAEAPERRSALDKDVKDLF